MISKIFLRFILAFAFLNAVKLHSIGCNPVTGLLTSSITHTTAMLNWDMTACDSFLVRYWETGTTHIHFKTVSPGTASNVAVDSLYPNTNYSWLIHTYCNGGQSGPYQAAPAQFTTMNGNVSCMAPNLLQAKNITNHAATVTWNNVIDADSFLVRYHVSGSGFYNWKYVPGNLHALSLYNLPSSTIYEWDVRTICDGLVNPVVYTDTFVTNCDTLPVPDHVVICIMENKGYQQIIDSFAIAPYINALAADPKSALFTQSYAIEHPSQPNYLDMFSGSNQGITNNNPPPAHFNTFNLARALLDSGKTFVSYSENLPYTGSDTVRSGNYERKHNPVANWMGTGLNQVPDTCNQPFTNFPADYSQLPTICYVVPDQISDMHNAGIDTGDTWLMNHMDDYVQWAKSHNSLFILTFDEDNHAYNNRIVTIFCGEMVQGGQYQKYMNHYSLLRTLEDMYGLQHTGHSSSVEAVRECWTPSATGIDEASGALQEWSVFSFTGTGELNVDFTLDHTSHVALQVYTEEGRLVYDQNFSRQPGGIHRVIINSRVRNASGIYFVRLLVDQHVYSKKALVIR